MLALLKMEQEVNGKSLFLVFVNTRVLVFVSTVLFTSRISETNPKRPLTLKRFQPLFSPKTPPYRAKRNCVTKHLIITKAFGENFPSERLLESRTGMKTTFTKKNCEHQARNKTAPRLCVIAKHKEYCWHLADES